MNVTTLLIAGTGLLVSAAVSLFSFVPAADPAGVNVRKPAAIAVQRTFPRNAEARTPFARTAESAEAANLATWQRRFAALRESCGDRESAVAAVLAEIGTVYQAWVRDQIALLADRPAGERRHELAEIEFSVHEGMKAVLEALGINNHQRVAVAAAASDMIAAEIEYAEAAPDSASRIAMLWLDRERQVRMDAAQTLSDETERAQSMTALEIWYQDSLAGIPAGTQLSP